MLVIIGHKIRWLASVYCLFTISNNRPAFRLRTNTIAWVNHLKINKRHVSITNHASFETLRCACTVKVTNSCESSHFLFGNKLLCTKVRILSDSKNGLNFRAAFKDFFLRAAKLSVSYLRWWFASFSTKFALSSLKSGFMVIF